MKANWIASIIGMTAFAACTLATPALANPQPVELIGRQPAAVARVIAALSLNGNIA